MNSDVLIIGGGVIGLSIARELFARGVREITVVDRGPIGRESSWAAAGMLAPNIETASNEDLHRFGLESAGLYPELSSALFEETGVDIELDRNGTLCLAFDETEAAELGEVFARRRSREVAVELLSSDDARRLEPALSSRVCSALLYANDWQVENRKLVTALQRFAEVNRVRIVENAEIKELLTAGSSIVGARTSRDDLTAGITVLATGAWTSLIEIAGVNLPVNMKPIRGQMISFDARANLLRHVAYGPRGYVVPRADGRILVGATVEDVGFDKTVSTEGVDSLRRSAGEIVPILAAAATAETWAGLRPFAADGLPILGKLPGYRNAFIATAHYRNGFLLAPRTAEIIADGIVEGNDSEYFKSFGLERFSSLAASV